MGLSSEEALLTSRMKSASKMSMLHFGKIARGVLGYNIAVILWGAYVRATGSGAGCGGHWPSCNGSVVPRLSSVQTLIEFTHRASVGVGLLAILYMVYAAFRLFPAGHRVRKAALWSVIFTLTEALIGAGLVLYGLVEHNASVYRAIAMSAHLINTLLLLSALLLTVWWGSGGERLKLKGQGAIGWALGIGVAAAMLLSVSGAVTALGDTLYPALSLIQGFQQDISPTAHFLIRLRFLHPLLAMSIGLYLLLVAGLVSYLRPSESVRKYARLTGSAILIQISAGFLNLGLLAPVWMQLVHLLLADLLWISLLLMSFAALAEGTPRVELGERYAEEDDSDVHDGAGTATFRDYLELTKPRVISLLLFTTLAAMIIAKGGWPGMVLFLSVTVGGYMAAGSANAINMVLDRDIDARMKRTSHRPTVTRTISSRNALIFAFSLELGSFLILTVMANLLSAMLALAGLVFYVLVYTLGLKRRTWHNIVIGGAAGAFPPLVGWAAATGQLNALAWWLFAVIFLWTPVHFWALAIMIKDDYALAGIPMLPVVRSERMTVAQIALYAVLTALISILPLAQGKVGYIYLVISFFLNAALLLRAAQLYLQPGRPRALSLYKYSMLYLALLFLTVAVDRVFR